MSTRRHVLDTQQLRMIRQTLIGQNTYFILGQNSIYVPKRREKYLDRKACVEWADLDGVVEMRPPGEIARIELKREWPDLKRVGWQRPHVRLFDWRWPMVFAGRYQGALVYTDLKAAYWQIYQRLWLNTALPCGFGSLDLLPVAKRLEKHKRARNSLIGLTRARTISGVKNGRLITLKSTNAFLSPGLWATVQCVLNEVAQLAVETGAIYIATDGYIHPQDSNHRDFHHLLDFRGLNYRTHNSQGEIVGWGNYRTSERQTVLNRRGVKPAERIFNTIQLFNDQDKTQILDWWSYRVPEYRERMQRNG